jgi:hypothetical protein
MPNGQMKKIRCFFQRVSSAADYDASQIGSFIEKFVNPARECEPTHHGKIATGKVGKLLRFGLDVLV